jgi:hypothetical protein
MKGLWCSSSWLLGATRQVFCLKCAREALRKRLNKHISLDDAKGVGVKAKWAATFYMQSASSAMDYAEVQMAVAAVSPLKCARDPR